MNTIEHYAKLPVDGRDIAQSRQGCENGFYVGATLFDHVTHGTKIHKEEISGPVLSIVRQTDYQSAVELGHGHGNATGTAHSTRDGEKARTFSQNLDVGMVAGHVPIPAPLTVHSFGGWTASILSDHAMRGEESMRSYTRIKTTITQWPAGH